jgi:hypothetical protein
MVDQSCCVRCGSITASKLPPRSLASPSAELPGDVVATHDANDLSADFLLDDRPPRHETEAEPVIDHGKPPAGELGRADQLAANGQVFVPNT